MTKQKGSLKRCPSCGAFFLCQGEGDCWCEQYRIPKKEMMVIMQQYTDCLCPKCLKKHESKV